MPPMKIKADLHTHTVFSHGKNTIEEMVDRARQLGLDAIVISDHGRSHPLYGVKPENFKVMREEVDRLNQKYADIQVYLSVEANITGDDGTIDIGDEERQYCDWIYAGYHWVYIPHRIGDFFTLKLRNYFAKVLPFLRPAVQCRNTQTYLKMMDRYALKMITHPGDKCPIDIEKVAQKAAEKNIILEINPRHHHLNVEELKRIAKYGGRFAINSDAHTVNRVADVDSGIAWAEAAGIPEERIVNIRSENQ
jgi:putative hydrolase